MIEEVQGDVIRVSLISIFFFESSMGTIRVDLGKTRAIHKFFLMNQSSILYDKMGGIVAIIEFFLWPLGGDIAIFLQLK